MKPDFSEFFLHFLERLLAQIANFHHLVFTLLGEFHDRGDASAFQAVIAANAEIEFFDQHVLIFIFLGLHFFFDHAVIFRVFNQREFRKVSDEKLRGQRDGFRGGAGSIRGDFKSQRIEF